MRRALPGEPRPRGFYRQLLLEGTPGSAAFVADGRIAVLLGVTAQLSGFRELGGRGFAYGGNIAGPARDLLSGKALDLLTEAVGAITRHFALCGLNGVDFILRDGVPHLLEVNPRYTASMELLEELAQINLFDIHLEALTRGRLPRRPLRVRRHLAKGILYATRRLVWMPSGVVRGVDVRDRPMPGETIEAGHPICTLVVSAVTPARCRRRLVESAIQVRHALAAAEGSGRRAPTPPRVPCLRNTRTARTARPTVLR